MRAIALAALCGLTTAPLSAELARVPADRALPPGVLLVEDYGRFRLVSGTADDFAHLRAAGHALAPMPETYRLAWPGQSAMDPQQREPFDRHQLPALASGEIHALQFHGPSKPEWLAALAADGIAVIQYLHPYTYLVWNGSGQLGPHVLKQAAVRWVGAFPLSARLSLPAARQTEAELDLRMLVFRGAGLDAARLVPLDARLLSRAATDPVIEEWHVRGRGNQAETLARLPGVLSVQEVRTQGGPRGEISNQHFAGNVGADQLPWPNYPDWLAGIGVDGSGVLLANVDGGVDQNHPNLVQRMRPCSGLTCGGPGGSLHGTATAGAMAADGSDGVRDSRGFLRGLGVAPGAALIEQEWLDFYQQPGGLLLLMRESVANGAFASNNSWGTSPSALGYDPDTRQIDIGARDTDPTTPGDQPLLYVLAIQNGGGGTSSQAAPDEAKNVLTVGSTQSQAVSGAPLQSWQSLSSNTAHGPALDGRLLPLVVTPGCRIDSTAQSGAHLLSCGTSFAAPHAAGAMALFGQIYQARFGQLPSPALARAFAVSATVDLFGGTDANGQPLTRRPNPKQGFGALRGREMFGQWPRTRVVDQQHIFTATGQSWSADWRVRRPDAPVKLALAWTDAPGHGLCNSPTCTLPAWNNDLDLVVQVGEQTFLGNVFGSDGLSTMGGTAEFRNNIELVSLPAGTSGPITVRVLAQNINSDALPNAPGTLQQDFALVCTNCVQPGEFTLDAPVSPITACAGKPAPPVPLTLVQLEPPDASVLLSTPGAPGAFGPSSFQPKPLIPTAAGTTAILSAQIVAATPPGLYTLPVRAASTAWSQQAEVQFAVRDLQATIQLAPLDGAASVPVSTALSWQATPNADQYRVEVARSADFSLITAMHELSGTSVVPLPRLRANTTYHWRVRAENACGPGPYATRSFITEGAGDALFSDGFPE